MLPPITFLGWIHTGCGIAAILIGAYALNKYKVISFSERAAKIYLLLTLITASTALAIYNQGGFRIAHVLAILTLLALIAGTIVEKTYMLGSLSKYFFTLCYTSTLLFHMIPAITDTLRRLPVGDPFATSLDDPLVISLHILFFVIFIFLYVWQVQWLKRET
tara:strand:- start:555 stop:1040 length:486 start_codon:yes stop_codon:yes gene_type:complete